MEMRGYLTWNVQNRVKHYINIFDNKYITKKSFLPCTINTINSLQSHQFLRAIYLFLNSGEVDPYKTALKNSTAITEQQLNPRFYWAEFSFSKIMICKLITLAMFCSTNLMQNDRTKFNSVEENETGNHSLWSLWSLHDRGGFFFSSGRMSRSMMQSL